MPGLPADVADAERGGGRGREVEKKTRADRRLGECRDASRLFADQENDGGRIQRVTEVTYLGYVYGTLAALKRMLPRDRGAIIQVGSALAYRGIPLQSGLLRREARHPGVLAIRSAANCCTTGAKLHLTMIQCRP